MSVSSLEEAVKIAPDAIVPLQALAKKIGKDEAETEQLILNFLVKDDEDLDSLVRRDAGADRITRVDVKAYEAARGLHPAVYYFDRYAGDFKPVLGVDIEDQEFAADPDPDGEDEEEKQRADKQSDDAIEEEIEQEDEDQGVDSESLTRAIMYVKRKTKAGDERDVPVNPVARLLRLLPADATAEEVVRKLNEQFVPAFVKEVMAVLSKSDPTSVARVREDTDKSLASGSVLHRFLLTDTALTHEQIDSVVDGVRSSLRASRSGETGLADLVSRGKKSESIAEERASLLLSDVKQRVTGLLSKSHTGKRLFRYLDRSSPKSLLTPYQQLEVDSGGKVTASAAYQVDKSFQAGMSFFGLRIKRPEDFTPDSVDQGERSARRLVDMSRSQNESDDVIDNSIDSDDGLLRTGYSRVDFALYSGEKGQIGGMGMGRATTLIRSGETVDTLYNRLRDEVNFDLPLLRRRRSLQIAKDEISSLERTGQRVGRRRKAEILRRKNTSESHTQDASPARINGALREEAQAIEHLTSQISVNAGSIALTKMRIIRDLIAFSCGLIEYLAFSGPEVLPAPGEETQLSVLASLRSVLIQHAERVRAVEHALTDSIVEFSELPTTLSDRQVAALRLRVQKLQRDIAVARQRGDEDAASRMQSEVKSKRRQIDGTASDRRRLEGVKQLLAGLQLERTLSDCSRFVDTLASGEYRALKATGLRQIELARTRIHTAQMQERSIKAAKQAQQDAGSGQEQERAIKAADHYGDQVSRAIRKIASNAESTIHYLRPEDTIDSLIAEYGIGQVITPADITIGSVYSLKLPARLGVSDEKRRYSVDKVVGQRNNRVVTLSYEQSGGEKAKIDVKMATLISLMQQQRVQKANFTPANEFRSQFTDAIAPAVRSMSRGGYGLSIAQIDSQRPIVEQLSELSYTIDEERSVTLQRSGITRIAKTLSAVDEQLRVAQLRSVIFEPTAQNIYENPRFRATLGLIVSLSNAVPRDANVKVTMRAAFPEMMPEIEAAARVISSPPAEGAATRQIKSASEAYREIVQQGDEFVESLLSRIYPDLQQVADGNALRESSRSMKEQGQYDEYFVGKPIPVPSSSLLSPGSRITIRAPARTLRRKGMERLMEIGVVMDDAISVPAATISDSIVASTLHYAFKPVMEQLIDGAEGAEGIASKLARRLEAAAKNELQQRTSPEEFRTHVAICQRGLRKMLLNNIGNLGNGASDVNAYKETIGSFVKTYTRSQFASITSAEEAEVERDTFAVRRQIQDLVMTLTGEVSRCLSTPSAVREISAMSPTLAYLLGPSVPITDQSRLVARVVLQDGGKIMTGTTAADFLTSVGISKTEGGAGAYMYSRELDRLRKVVKTVDTYHRIYQTETDKNGIINVVLARLRAIAKHDSPGASDNEVQQRVQEMLNVRSRDTAQITASAIGIAELIDDEIAYLSGGYGARIMTVISAAAERFCSVNLQRMSSLPDVSERLESVRTGLETFVNELPLFTISALFPAQEGLSAVYERALLKIVPGVRNSLRQRLSSARRAAGIEIPEDVDETEGGQDDDND